MNCEIWLVHDTKNVQMKTRGERTGIFPIILKRVQMEEKGQVHTPAALTLGEKLTITVEWEASWAPKLSGCSEKIKISFPAGNLILRLKCPNHCLATILTELLFLKR